MAGYRGGGGGLEDWTVKIESRHSFTLLVRTHDPHVEVGVAILGLVICAYLTYTSLRYLTLPHATLGYLTLPYATLRYLTLPYSTFLYLTLPYATSRYLTLPYSTLRYLTLPHATLQHSLSLYGECYLTFSVS